MATSSWNWDDLRVLLAVLETGSYSEAARTMAISQPTVGRRIRALEQAIGCQLIERHAGHVRPTERALALLPELERVREATAAIDRLAAQRLGALSGTVRVACGDMVGMFVSRHTEGLTSEADGLELEVLIAHQLVSLDRGEAELALRNSRPDSGQIRARRIGTVAYASYASPRYVDRDPAVNTPARFERSRWIGFDQGRYHLPSARFLSRRRNGQPAELRFNSQLLALDACAAGAGVAVLPTFVAELRDDLLRVDGPYSELELDLWMLRHQDARSIERVGLIADRLIELFQRPSFGNG